MQTYHPGVYLEKKGGLKKWNRMEGRRGGGRRRKGRKGKGKDPVDLIPQEKFPTYVTAKKIYALIHKKSFSFWGTAFELHWWISIPKTPLFHAPNLKSWIHPCFMSTAMCCHLVSSRLASSAVLKVGCRFCSHSRRTDFGKENCLWMIYPSPYFFLSFYPVALLSL